MLSRILVLAFLLAVGACSTTATKETTAVATGNAMPVAAPPTPSTTTPAPASGAANTPSPAMQPSRVPDPLKDPGNILYRRNVYFDFDKSLVRDSDRPLLEAHAKYLREHPDTRLTIQGNTDERGSREYNIALGELRSGAVRRLLTLLGVNDRQLESVSFGKEKPRCTVSEESCWAQNRRADLVYPGE